MGLDLLTEVTLPDAIMANGDILHGKPARQMPQDHHAGDQGVDALRRVAQNQVGGVLITAAEPRRQGVQLLAGEDAPLLRQAESPCPSAGRSLLPAESSSHSPGTTSKSPPAH